MAADRRNQIVLGALLVVLAVVAYRATNATSVANAPASNGRGATAQEKRGANAQTTVDAPDVHLKSLSDARAQPVGSDRNLFAFKPKAPPTPARPVSTPTATPAPVAAVPSGPLAPPPPPPITLKFIGVMEQGTDKPKIALLSDSTGHVFSGTEGGPPIEGRYRILRIGAESIEMSYLDGRGRQTIRLTGS
jgi:hypothetical protein